MKTSIKLTIMAALLLSGCTGMKQLPDGRYLSATTVKDSLDRSATYVQILEEDGQDAEGNKQFKQVAGDLTVGDTTEGRVLQGITNGTGAAYLYKRGMENAARTKAGAYKCPPGSEVCHSTILMGAEAYSSSNSGSAAEVNITETSSMCPSGDCDF